MWVDEAFNGITCEQHDTANEFGFCLECDTGQCADCGEALMWHEWCGWYHHIYDVAPCFQADTVCTKVTADE